jgi:hypothetical protein
VPQLTFLTAIRRGMQKNPSRAALNEKIVPAPCGLLPTMQQLVERLAVRGTESQVMPATAVPKVEEANTQTEFAAALRTTFHGIMGALTITR